MEKIDVELIQQAKEDLGERAAEIIASGLGIEKWDTRNLKGLCPIHDEGTPSFIWNKKDNSFKCFGCGETMDILDYYMGSGDTFREAAEKLFDEAGVQYEESTPTQKPRTKENRPYKQPTKEESMATGNVQAYLELRKISKGTIEYAGVKQDHQGNVAFEFYDEKDRLMLTKYRPARKLKAKDIKTWCQKGADTSPVLYGMHQIDPTKPLLITEGEIDRLAAIESGFKNAVSVPFGANNYHWIEHNWEWLEQFEEIVLWADSDKSGEEMRKEVVPRLGSNRTRYVESKYEDLNVELYMAGKESVIKSIEKAVYIPIEDVVRMADVEYLDPDKIEKISSGVNGLNRFIGGWHLGTINVITGVNGSGKSTFINQACICEAVDQGYKTFVLSGELTNPQLKNWIEYPMAGHENITERDNGKNEPKSYYVDRKVKKAMEEWYQDKIYFYDNELDYTAASVLSKMEEMAQRYGVKVFVLDNLMMIDLECNQYEVLRKQKDFVKDLVFFARKYNSVVHLVAHPRKTDLVGRLNKMDVAGSGDITNLAHYVTSIHRVTEAEKEDKVDKLGNLVEEGCPFDCIIDLFKNRPTGHQDKAIGVSFDIASKRYYGESDDLYRMYGWQKTDAMEVVEQQGFQFTTSEDCPF